MLILLGKIVAVPVRLLADILEWIHIFDPTLLRMVLWKLGRSEEDGCRLLMSICKAGVSEQARSKAREMLSESKNCMLAAAIGHLEIQHGNNIEAAKRWVEMAKNNGCSNPEFLLFLELLIGAREGCESEQVIEAILDRNDLPASYTRAALFSKAWKLAEKQQWSETELIADRILSIEEQVDARFIKWITCSVDGEHAAAEGHLSMAKKQISTEWFNALVAQGWLFMGYRQGVMEWLYKAHEAGFKLEESSSPLGSLANSEEFKRYCENKGGK
jgi:hypothetical protein